MGYEWGQNDTIVPAWGADDPIVGEAVIKQNDDLIVAPAELIRETPVGFIEAAGEDIAGKVPFSPTPMLEVADIVGATRRLQDEDYDKPPLFSSLTTKEQQSTARAFGAWTTPTAGLPDKWTPELQRQHDIKIVTDYLKDLEEKQRRGYTTLGRVGQITTAMPSFVVEFVATGGLAKIGTKAGRTIATKALRRYAATNAGKAMIATGGFAAGAGLRAAGMPHRAAEAILRRQAPRHIEIKDNGSVNVVGPVEKPLTSVYKGLADHYIEIASEQAGEVFVPAFSKLVGKTPFMGKVLNKLQNRWLSRNPKKTSTDFLRKIRDKAGFHGVIGEIGEEYLGDTTRAILDVEHFGAGEDASIDERLAAAVKTDTANLPAMLISFAIPGVITNALARDINKQKGIAKEYRDHLQHVVGFELDAPSQIETAEGVLGYEPDITTENYMEKAKEEKVFKRPKVRDILGFTPKWLLHRLLGLETTLKDVTMAEEGLQLEKQHMNSWIRKLIPKLKKEKGLTNLPHLLPTIAEMEVINSVREVASSIPLGLHQAPVIDAKLRDLSDEDLDAIEESVGEQLDVLERQFDENLALEEDLEFRKHLASVQQQWGAIENEQYFRRMQNEDLTTWINEFIGLRPARERDKLRMVLLLGAIKDVGGEAEFTKALNARAARDHDWEAIIQGQVDGLKDIAEDVRKAKMSIEGDAGPTLSEPIPLEETRAHILQKKIGYDTNPVHIMRDLLDTYEDAPSFLSESEARIFNQVRELTRYLRDRANRVRKQLGLEPIGEVKEYITHWMDSISRQILQKDLPVHSGFLYKLMQGLPKKIENPTAMHRKIREDVEAHFSKDLGKLLRIMVAFDLKEIYIRKPYEAAWDELQQLRRDRLIPDSTYKQAEKFLLYDIRKQKTQLDKAFDIALQKPADLLNKILPIKRAITDPSRQLFGLLSNLQTISGLGLRLRPAFRNLGQKLLLTDLYRHVDYAKARAVAIKARDMPIVKHPITGENVQLMDLVREQDWYQLALSKFAEMDFAFSGVAKASLYLYSKTHAGVQFLSNVETAALTGYFDWQQAYQKSQDKSSRHWRNAYIKSKKENIPLEDLLTQESDMLWNMREAVRRTQWEYFNTSMPAIYRGYTTKSILKFQSWWMNYFFNHMQAMWNQTLTGRNSLGRLLTPDGRYRAVKGLGSIVAISKLGKTIFGVEMLKYLFLPAPTYLPPIPELVAGLTQLISALIEDDDRKVKRAWRRIKYGLSFWIPFSQFGKDLNKLLSGEHSIADFLFYRPKDKDKK